MFVASEPIAHSGGVQSSLELLLSRDCALASLSQLRQALSRGRRTLRWRGIWHLAPGRLGGGTRRLRWHPRRRLRRRSSSRAVQLSERHRRSHVISACRIRRAVSGRGGGGGGCRRRVARERCDSPGAPLRGGELRPNSGDGLLLLPLRHKPRRAVVDQRAHGRARAARSKRCLLSGPRPGGRCGSPSRGRDRLSSCGGGDGILC